MSQRSHMTINSLVWGKVGCYPWWPGKIVKKIEQNDQTVYKISFFGDSSFSYLHAEHIIPYARFDFDLNSTNSQDFKLQKAVQFAQKLHKRKSISNKSTDEEAPSPDTQTHTLSFLIDTVTINEGAVEEDKTLICQHQSETLEPQRTQLIATEVTVDNVIGMIESSLNASKNSYSYSSRKQIVQFKERLRDVLLAKYKLSNRFNQAETEFKENKSINAIKIDRRFKKHRLIHKIPKYSKTTENTNAIRIKAIKKLHNFIVQIAQMQKQSKNTAIRLFQLIQRKAHHCPKRQRQLYLTLIQKINLSSKENTKIVLADWEKEMERK